MILLLFGAGASFGSGDCCPSPPPLGNDLFLKLDEFGGAFSKLDNESKQVFRTQGFEAGMTTVSDDSRQINPLQKELACYLSSFSIKPNNAYVRLFGNIKNHINNIRITTLNYDLLIEQSLLYNNFNVDYNGKNNGVTVIKAHGSSNFLPQLNGLTLSGNVMKGVGTFVEGLETKAVFSAREVEEWCKDPKNSDISPILAMYEKGKRVVVNRKLIDNLQQLYSDIVKTSAMIILVGIKYIEHDYHIWNPISESSAKFVIVDPYPDQTVNWIENKKLNILSTIANSFNDSIEDITTYIKSETFKF